MLRSVFTTVRVVLPPTLGLGLRVNDPGVPFKFASVGHVARPAASVLSPDKWILQAITTHTKFVQDVRFSPSGDHLASVGSDAKIFIYNGASGETAKEITCNSHTGSIVSTDDVVHGDIDSDGYQTACGWSPDSNTLMTVSADSTVKLCKQFCFYVDRDVSKMENIGDVEASKLVTSWSLGTGVSHQQVGGTWTEGDEIVSLSMSSDLNIFDKRVADEPSRIIRVR